MINAFLQWFDGTRLWKWFARNILAHLTFRIWSYPAFDFETYHELEAILSTSGSDYHHAYAFVSADRATLASMLIRLVSKSQWSHAGWIIKSKEGVLFAVHMKGKGLVVQRLAGLLRECDDFALVRIPVSDRDAVLANIHGYMALDRVHYDFEQELDDEASPLKAKDVYCSELVWLCAKDHANLVPSMVVGRKAFSPNDVSRSGDIVWSHIAPR